MSQNIYVASSWRNPFQPAVVEWLRQGGHEVYDFRNPAEGDNGFHWSEIDPDWQNWTPGRYRAALREPLAEDGFAKDRAALEWCSACVLVLPCGRSAHLELGYAIGEKKRSAILMPDEELARLAGVKVPQVEPELINKLADFIALSMPEVDQWLEHGP